MKKKSSGYTMIELMIVVVVVSILVGVSYPAYTGFTARSQRATAKTELARIAQLQERFYIDNRIYATLTQLGFAADTIGIDPSGNEVAAGAGVYNITITPAPTAIAYLAQATATGAQTSDTGCTTLAVTATGVQSPAACW